MSFQEVQLRAADFKHYMHSIFFSPGRELKATICPNVLKQIKSKDVYNCCASLP